MKLSNFLRTGFAALALTAGVAFAAQPPVTTSPTNPLVLDPALQEAGNATQTVCDGPGFPACQTNPTGPVSYTVTFTNPGFLTASIVPSVVDTSVPNPNAEFTVLSFKIFDPSNTLVASGNVATAVQNLAIVAGLYTITVDYTFTSTPGSDSAKWSMPLTTGRARLAPEPGTLALLGIGLAALGFSRRRKS